MFPWQAALVQSLVRELRSHMLCGLAKKREKFLFLKYFLDNFTYLIFEISVMLPKRFTKGVLLALSHLLFCKLTRLSRVVNDHGAVVKMRIKASAHQGACASWLCHMLAA